MNSALHISGSVYAYVDQLAISFSHSPTPCEHHHQEHYADAPSLDRSYICADAHQPLNAGGVGVSLGYLHQMQSTTWAPDHEFLHHGGGSGTIHNDGMDSVRVGEVMCYPSQRGNGGLACHEARHRPTSSSSVIAGFSALAPSVRLTYKEMSLTSIATSSLRSSTNVQGRSNTHSGLSSHGRSESLSYLDGYSSGEGDTEDDPPLMGSVSLASLSGSSSHEGDSPEALAMSFPIGQYLSFHNVSIAIPPALVSGAINSTERALLCGSMAACEQTRLPRPVSSTHYSKCKSKKARSSYNNGSTSRSKNLSKSENNESSRNLLYIETHYAASPVSSSLSQLPQSAAAPSSSTSSNLRRFLNPLYLFKRLRNGRPGVEKDSRHGHQRLSKGARSSSSSVSSPSLTTRGESLSDAECACIDLDAVFAPLLLEYLALPRDSEHSATPNAARRDITATTCEAPVLELMREQYSFQSGGMLRGVGDACDGTGGAGSMEQGSDSTEGSKQRVFMKQLIVPVSGEDVVLGGGHVTLRMTLSFRPGAGPEPF